jgi:hypothetical protein
MPTKKSAISHGITSMLLGVVPCAQYKELAIAAQIRARGNHENHNVFCDIKEVSSRNLLRNNTFGAVG